jgi:hypothetical protein
MTVVSIPPSTATGILLEFNLIIKQKPRVAIPEDIIEMNKL